MEVCGDGGGWKGIDRSNWGMMGERMGRDGGCLALPVTGEGTVETPPKAAPLPIRFYPGDAMVALGDAVAPPAAGGTPKNRCPLLP